MVKLNLPEFSFKIKEEEGKVLIFDIIRKKFVVLTPEEWVRQHFYHYLIHHKGYPKALMKIEAGLKYHKMAKRTDIMVYDRAGNPLMLVECKSPKSSLSQKVFDQIALYNSSFGARILGVTNGIKHFCWKVDKDKKQNKFLDYFPGFEEA